MRSAKLTLCLIVLALAAPLLAGAQLTPMKLRALIYRTDPCLAHIIDVEGGRWQPTESYGGGYGDVYASYGLPQADPGTKMASAGADWRTNPWTQLRWAEQYAVERYGSTCAAWQFREANGYW